jgi:hypothetical protein
MDFHSIMFCRNFSGNIEILRKVRTDFLRPSESQKVSPYLLPPGYGASIKLENCSVYPVRSKDFGNFLSLDDASQISTACCEFNQNSAVVSNVAANFSAMPAVKETRPFTIRLITLMSQPM